VEEELSAGLVDGAHDGPSQVSHLVQGLQHLPCVQSGASPLGLGSTPLGDHTVIMSQREPPSAPN
jgi:hypothetical protein